MDFEEPDVPDKRRSDRARPAIELTRWPGNDWTEGIEADWGPCTSGSLRGRRRGAGLSTFRADETMVRECMGCEVLGEGVQESRKGCSVREGVSPKGARTGEAGPGP